MKTILLHVGADPHFEARLQGALDLTRFVGGHLECLQSLGVPMLLGAEPGGFGGAAAVAQMMEEEGRAAEEERRRLAPRLEGEQVPFSFVDAVGDPARTLVDRSLLADAVVLTLPAPGERDLGQLLAAVVTRGDAPVLAMPSEARRLEVEKPMLVAWKPESEAAHAVKRAVPLLQRATRVDILTIDPADHASVPPAAVAAYLARHDVRAELHERQSGDRSTADTLLDTARELGAGLVVMGGYGRSRAMEFLLGGVTRRLLGMSDVALLMTH